MGVRLIWQLNSNALFIKQRSFRVKRRRTPSGQRLDESSKSVCGFHQLIMIITKFHSTSTTQADRGNFDGHGREKSDSKQHKLCTFYDIEVMLWKHDNKEWNSNMSKRRIIATSFPRWICTTCQEVGLDDSVTVNRELKCCIARKFLNLHSFPEWRVA